jgi:hypothetical protein
MNLGRGSSVVILAAAFLMAGAVGMVRADNNSEAAGQAQSSGKQAEGKVIEQPPAKTTEPWIITVGAPGWLASVSGISGFRGANANINVIYSFGGEVRRGRFGALGDLLYLNAQAGQATPGLVSKLDLGLQQLFWRDVNEK